MFSRRTAEQVGVPDLTHCLAQLKFKLEPVKLGDLVKKFGASPTSEKPWVPERTRRLAESTLDRPPYATPETLCTVTFGGQTLARRKKSAIRQKDSLIADLP
uniref:Uncharacterized protein n=1 Tax=Solanum tuberosum TaxID=4113 RepID=M1DMG1_SOLTU